MPKIKVAGQYAEVDITNELEQFPWTRPRWSSDKLIAASPFRYDNTPSFFVNLDGDYAGSWGDSGAYDADYESGGFVKLLAFLRDETYEETVEYLLDVYGASDNDGTLVMPTLSLPKPPRKPVVLAQDILDPYAFKHPYLERRGITEKVQRFMGVGFRKDAQAVVIPWRHANGASLANVKYRKVRGKAFWYERGAEPIRNLVYGLDKIYAQAGRDGWGEVWICEAEIDAMSVYVRGQPAVAIGGASVSERQLELLRKAPVSTYVIATDNDKAGEKLRRQLIEGLRGCVRMKAVAWTEVGGDVRAKEDVNWALMNDVELPIKEVRAFPELGVGVKSNLGRKRRTNTD